MSAIVETEVVIVGGGVIGCSIAWHLGLASTREVLVVERNEIGSGTTSCAAGLLGQVRSSAVQMVTTGKTSFDLTPFRVDRFGRVDPRTPEFRRACGLARSGKYTLAHAR